MHQTNFQKHNSANTSMALQQFTSGYQNGNCSSTNAGFASAECILCKKPSVCVCQRCGDYYCSPQCQRRDWPSHRYICFPMPHLVRADTCRAMPNEPAIPVLTSNKIDVQQQDMLKTMLKIPTEANLPPALAPLADSTHQKAPTNANSRDAMHKEPQNSRQRQQFTAQHKNQTASIMPTSPMPKANSRVVLTGFRSTNRCYIRCLTAAENEGFMRVARAVDTYGKTAPVLDTLPKQNSYAISNLDQGGIMCRVQVLGARNKNNIRVLFCDYGTIAVRQLSKLREITDEIVKLQQHSLQVQLKNVDNYVMNDELKTFLAKFEDMELKIQYSNERDERGGNVVLREWQSGESLNEKIVNFNANNHFYSTEVSASVSVESVSVENCILDKVENRRVESNENTNSNSKLVSNQNKRTREAREIQETRSEQQATSSTQGAVMVAPFATRILNEGDANVDVLVLDNSCLEFGYFGCIVRNDVKNLAKIHEYLKKFVDTERAYKPRLHEYCIAKFEGDWYRAKVTSIPKDNQYTVLYIDYTNESTVKGENIRPYPIDLNFECATNLCLIDGLPTDLSDDLVKYLQKLVPINEMLKLDMVKSIDEQIVVVALPALIKKLQNDGLI